MDNETDTYVIHLNSFGRGWTERAKTFAEALEIAASTCGCATVWGRGRRLARVTYGREPEIFV